MHDHVNEELSVCWCYDLFSVLFLPLFVYYHWNYSSKLPTQYFQIFKSDVS